MVPNAEVNVAEGQYKQSVSDALTIGIEPITDDEEAKDSIESEMLISISERASMPMGVSDVPFPEDSSDLGSWVNKESRGLCDGDLAYIVDLEPGHSFIILKDRGMMMNINEAEHARNTWGIEP